MKIENTKTQEIATTPYEAKALAAGWIARTPGCEGLDANDLRAWVRLRMDNASRTAAPFLDCQKAVWILDVATALELSLVDAEKLCEWAGWPS